MLCIEQKYLFKPLNRARVVLINIVKLCTGNFRTKYGELVTSYGSFSSVEIVFKIPVTGSMHGCEVFCCENLRLPKCFITLKHSDNVSHIIPIYFCLAVAQKFRQKVFN